VPQNGNRRANKPVGQSAILSTGIEELDRLLGGGLPRHRGYMIRGPIHVGKRFLALAIQRASLLRGEYNQYSTYAQTYEAVLELYRAAGIDPLEFMSVGLLNIVDYHTAELLKPDELVSVRRNLPPILKDHVFFMSPNRLETEMSKYIAEMREYISNVGRPGTVIIDSLNERLQQAPTQVVLNQWRVLKSRMSTQSGLLSLHIYTPLGTSIEKEYAEIFSDFEDGIIELRARPDGEREMRLAMRMPPIEDTQWHRYRIIGTSFVIEREGGEVAALEAGMLTGIGGAFAAQYGASAAKWLWEETERLIERIRIWKREGETESVQQSGEEEVATLFQIEGDLPQQVGLPQLRTILPEKLDDMMLDELSAAREEVEIFHKRYLQYRLLVAQAGDYAEQREIRNRDDALEKLNAALLRLMGLVKAVYGSS